MLFTFRRNDRFGIFYSSSFRPAARSAIVLSPKKTSRVTAPISIGRKKISGSDMDVRRLPNSDDADKVKPTSVVLASDVAAASHSDVCRRSISNDERRRHTCADLSLTVPVEFRTVSIVNYISAIYMNLESKLNWDVGMFL